MIEYSAVHLGCFAIPFTWRTSKWYQRLWELRDTVPIHRTRAEANLTMNSPWKNLRSVNQPADRLQRASAGNTESLMLCVPLQPFNEISGQSDWIILMVFSRFLPRALTILTDKARSWKYKAEWWIYKYNFQNGLLIFGIVEVITQWAAQWGFYISD